MPPALGDLAAAARDYARRGWAVFPCAPGEKSPACAHGVDEATTDQGQILEWWGASGRNGCQMRNVAVSMKRSNLVVVDVDLRTHADGSPDYGGLINFARLEAELGPLPRTCLALTPRNGAHYYFVAPGVRLRAKAAYRVDVQRDNTYVMAPPSSRIDGSYRWAIAGEPGPLPDRWIDFLREPETETGPVVPPAGAPSETSDYGAAALGGIAVDIATAVPGERHHALNKAAFRVGQLVAGGEVEPREGQRVLLEAAAAQPEVRGEDRAKEVARTIRDALVAGQRAPRSAPPRPEGDTAPDPEGTAEPTPGREGGEGPLVVGEVHISEWSVPAPEFLVDDHVLVAGRALLVGDPGDGKSYIALSLAVAVASGLPFLGRWPVKQGKVLLWMPEDLSIWRPRAEVLAAQYGVRCADLPLFHTTVNTGVLLLDEKPQMAALAAHVEKSRPTMLVLDPMRDIMAGDENSSTDLRPLLADLRRLTQDTRCTVVLVHHAGRGSRPEGMRARGSTAIPGWRDSCAEFSKKGNIHTVAPYVKCRPRMEPWSFTIDEHTGIHFADERSLATQIREAITDGIATRKELALLLGVAYDTIKKQVQRMIKNNDIEEADNGKLQLKSMKDIHL